jgi:hypothetical protein
VVPVPPRVGASAPVHPGVKVCVEPDDVIVRVIFASVPVAKFCVEVEIPLRDVRPDPPLAIILVVAMIPFTLLVRMFVDVAKLMLFVVDDATIPTSEVLAITPFTFDVMTFPVEESVLFEITVVVAETPLMVVVRTFPVND